MTTPLVLTRPHTHAGQQRQAGERIEVDADIAQWLLSIGAARAAPPSTPSENPPAREAQPFQRKEPKP